ncbi:MAG: branched-chain amino acid ABC transporter permease [Hyphomicrobiales bacterium]|nr:branched-chain amino acid ABC transporter permease [Hyphomicrobiales bacterium]
MYSLPMRRGLRPVIVLLLLPLSGCLGSVDSEQLRVCRQALPALHPEGTLIDEIGAAPATLGRQGVRIDYDAREPGEPGRLHFATCGFGGSVFSTRRLDLVAVDTDQGPLGEARLTYLNRFWLGGPAREAEPSETPSIAEIPLAAAYALQQFINAVALAASYALLATAYSLIYGLIGRINLAFGDMTVIGALSALAAVAASAALGLADPVGGLAVALAFGAALAALWSWFTGVAVVAPLHARYRVGQPILVATVALSIAIQEFLRLSGGAHEHWFPALFNQTLPLARAGAFVVTATPIQLIIAVAALGAAAAVLALIARSRFGREWRAFADDPATAALFGVAARRLLASTFLLAGALAGLAGWVIAVYYGNIGFAMGTMLGLKALVAAVLGGIGSVSGAFLGGVLVALIEAGWSAYFDIGYRDVVVYSLLIVVFVLRPGGLLGFSGPQPRDV